MSHLHLSDKDPNADNYVDKIPEGYQVDVKKPTRYVLLLSGNCIVYKTNDIPYGNFHQNSSFNYLSGWSEPGSIMLLETTMGRDHKSVLFVPRKTDQQSVHQGESATPEAIKEFTGVNEVLIIDHETDGFQEYVSELLKDSERDIQFFVNQGTGTNMDTWMQYMQPTLSMTKAFENVTVVIADPFISEFRLHKSEAEQKLLRQSCAIASKSLEMIREQTSQCTNESQIAAALNFASSNLSPPGCNPDFSFPTQVGRHDRMVTPLYTKSNGDIDMATDSVTVDFGVNYFGYSSDVSRVYGCKTEAHRELYNSLYFVHKTMIEVIQDGRKKVTGRKDELTINHIHRMMQALMMSEFKKLGFAEGEGFERLSEIFQVVCPLYVGHFIGLDVHDCASVSRDIPIQPGMAFTIEPGFYIPENLRGVPEKFTGIGMRLEDTLLVNSKNKVEVLTAFAEKDPEVLFDRS